MDAFKGIWYGRKHGWKGGSISDAKMFCNNIGHMDLCPMVSYCPDGKSLLNNMQPFVGEQWSPTQQGNWVQTGSGSVVVSSSTCESLDDLTNRSDHVKQHIMCCAKYEQGSTVESLET